MNFIDTFTPILATAVYIGTGLLITFALTVIIFSKIKYGRYLEEV